MRPEILEQIGLTKSESDVYLALLELGSTTTGKIVDKSKASSSKIYEILDRLMQKGLVSFIIKNGMKHFEAASPDRIMDYLKEKEQELKKQQLEVESIIPELKLKQQFSKYKSEATIYRGVKGLHTAFYSALEKMNSKDEMLVFGVPQRSDAVNNFFIKLNKEKARRKIKTKTIFNEAARGEPQTMPKNSPLTEFKFMPETTPAAINVMKDRVLIFPSETETEPVIFDIENKGVANSFKVYFEKLWGQEIQTYNGQEAVESIYEQLLEDVTPNDEVLIFAAKPKTTAGADYNVLWNKKIHEKTKKVKLLYYGHTQENIERARVMSEIGNQAKITPTEQTLPISTVVIKNVVLNSVWNEKPVAFKIENEVVADSLRRNFNYLWNQDTSVFKGFSPVIEELKRFVGNFEKNDTFDVFGTGFGVQGKEDMYAKVWGEFHNYRKKKGIRARWLFQQGTKDLIEKNKNNYTLGDVKYLPYKNEAPVAMYSHKDEALILIQGKEPTIIKINNKEIADAFHKQFEMQWEQEVRVMRGFDAAELAFNEMLEAGHCDFLSARGYMIDRNKKFMDGWAKRAMKSGFTMRNLVDPEIKGHPITQHPFATTKYTLRKEFALMSVFWIYGNKVVIVNWTEEQPIMIFIENKKITEMYKQQYEFLWNS